MTPFRRLLDLFRARFFENDLLSPSGGFERNIFQLLAVLSTVSVFITWFTMPTLMEQAYRQPGPAVDWALRTYRLFFAAYSFAVVGFATVFEWDTLFPDRRDFLVLGSFPIRLRTLFSAKVCALGLFLVTLISAVNGVMTFGVPLISLGLPKLREAGFLRLIMAQIVATWGAGAMGFLIVAGIQGVLINLTSPRMFRRISPSIQMAGMSGMILSLLMYPVYSLLLWPAVRAHAYWPWLFPPVWFTGLYDLLLPHGDPKFAYFGTVALAAMGAALIIFSVTWALGFRRHYRRTLESEDTESRRPRISLFERFAQSEEERAIFRFTGKMLARSALHRLFLAMYWSVGVSIGVLATVTVYAGHAGVSADGMRAFPLLFAFFAVSGLRGAFQFPAELSSNWIFRLNEESWAETARRATRKRVVVSGLLPVLLVFLPIETAYWGGTAGVFHSVFQLATGALLVEILFWSFDKVPFTCSYFPGKVNLALLAAFFLYGFTTYSFHMADLEKALDGRPVRAAGFFVLAAALLAIAWRRRGKAAGVRFDATEQELTTLDLT